MRADPLPPPPGPLLVVAAHPDDETIGAGALLTSAEAPVIVHLTDGAPRDRRFWPRGAPDAARAYARLRRRELERALERGGATGARAVSLRAPDQEAAFHLARLARALARLVVRLCPSALVTHPYEGGHPDHDAAAFASRAALALVQRAGRPTPPLVEMTSYHADGGALEAGAFLPAGGGRQVARRLSPTERARKEAMLAAFESQREVLAPFRADEERFRAGAACDFAAPPHPGPLWYERLGFPLAGERWRELARRAAEELRLGPAAPR